MKYAIELYFDEVTEKTLSALAQRVADEKIGARFSEYKTRPHLTLACYNDVDEQKCAEQLRRFALSRKTIPAHIGSVGMFNDTKTIFVSPVMNRSMYRLQAELSDLLKEYDSTGWEWYSPDRWAPHCTLALFKEGEDDAFYRASELILREFKKVSGRFVAIGLVRITFPVNEVYTAELSRET